MTTTIANDNGALDQYLEYFYHTNDLTPFLYPQKYQVKNHETITIAPQGVGEMFSVYFSENTKKYGFSFSVTSQDDVLKTSKCSDYQKDINYVLSNYQLFLWKTKPPSS